MNIPLPNLPEVLPTFLLVWFNDKSKEKAVAGKKMFFPGYYLAILRCPETEADNICILLLLKGQEQTTRCPC